MTTVYRALIPVEGLLALQARGAALVLLDCSFDLADPVAGESAFHAAHLPGSQYAHLERDLSGPKTGRNGRHPLPDRQALARRAGEWGIAPGVQVVCVDDHGMMYAARAWWLLRWLGHDAVAVLDGGKAAWRAAGQAMSSEPPTAEARPPYPATEPAMPSIDAAALHGQLGNRPIVDARSAERYRGENETLDPVAGHIPGAGNRFFKLNLGADGRFKPLDELRAAFAALGAPERVVHSCGSGVTACHNLLAMEAAGLTGSTLYPGSWSEWCADPARPVARG
jgi:thiosulfate/3-mercaptopyruvate sulfurtransferase